MPAEITLKGRELAERRRAYLVELYDTGRWQHYYTQEQLLVRMREALKMIQTWERLATPPSEQARALAAE
jgi:uncharacterized repeat protein (TIGR03809 family)